VGINDHEHHRLLASTNTANGLVPILPCSVVSAPASDPFQNEGCVVLWTFRISQKRRSGRRCVILLLVMHMGGILGLAILNVKSIFLHNIKNDHMSGSSFLLTQCVIPLSSPQWREVYAIMLNAISYCYSTESQFLLSAHNEDARRRSKGDISQETIPHVFCECIFVPLRRVSLAFEVALRKVVPSF
jgi:hypothetical protein